DLAAALVGPRSQRQPTGLAIELALLAVRVAQRLLLERAVRAILRDRDGLAERVALLLVAKHAFARPPPPAADLSVRAALDLAVDPALDVGKPSRVAADARRSRRQWLAVGSALAAVAREVADRVVRLAVARVVAHRPHVRRRLRERLLG